MDQSKQVELTNLKIFYDLFSSLKKGENLTSNQISLTNPNFLLSENFFPPIEKTEKIPSLEKVQKIFIRLDQMDEAAYKVFQAVLPIFFDKELQKKELYLLALSCFKSFIGARKGLYSWSFSLRKKEEKENLEGKILLLTKASLSHQEKVTNLFLSFLIKTKFSFSEKKEELNEASSLEKGLQLLQNLQASFKAFSTKIKAYNRELDTQKTCIIKQFLQVEEFKKYFSIHEEFEEELNKISFEKIEKAIDLLHDLFFLKNGKSTAIGLRWLSSLFASFTAIDTEENHSLHTIKEEELLQTHFTEFPLSYQKLWQKELQNFMFAKENNPHFFLESLEKAINSSPKMEETTKKKLKDLTKLFLKIKTLT